jgi:hydrogenase-4 component B
MTIGLILASIVLLLTGGIVCAFSGKSKLASGIGVTTSTAAAVLAVASAGTMLWTGTGESLKLAWNVPFGSFYIAIDPLSAFFIIVISIVCALAAIYGTAYLAPYRARKNLGAAWCFYNLLFASMLLVVIARNGVLFLIAWESMSLSSFFLVMFEHEKIEVREAGWIYLIAAHIGQACLMFMFILLAGHNSSLDFDKIVVPVTAATGAIFILAVAGFGAKAGFLPLHVWLPEAHPAAPSHVSAVMSGVMIKTGIYGLVRVISFLGIPSPWWGWTLLIIGAATGIIGVLFAIAQNDIKRLLAYSSVENIGIICLGLGLWLLGVSINNPVLASLGLMGGLLHALNHSLFKSLLFYGAGSVVHATNTRDMNLMGGLKKRMPQTAITFAIGAAAICGLPPLNGFIGELLIYLGAFGVIAKTEALSGPVAGGLIALTALALIGGLAAVCFTKVFGTVFLGEPRSESAAHSHEAPRPMLFAMITSAALCIFMGLGGPLAIKIVTPVAAQLLGGVQAAETAAMASRILIKISIAGGAIIILAGIFWGLRSLLLAGRTTAKGPTWDCGYLAPTSRMQYTASSFSWPVTDMFKWLVRPRLHAAIRKEYFPHYAELSSRTDDVFRQRIFAPVFKWAGALALRIHALQEGRNQLYVLYIAITILILLLVKVR